MLGKKDWESFPWSLAEQCWLNVRQRGTEMVLLWSTGIQLCESSVGAIKMPSSSPFPFPSSLPPPLLSAWPRKSQIMYDCVPWHHHCNFPLGASDLRMGGFKSADSCYSSEHMCEEKEQCQFEREITSEKSLLLNQVLQRPVENSD